MIAANVCYDVMAHYHSHLTDDEIGMSSSIRDCLLGLPLTGRDRSVHKIEEVVVNASSFYGRSGRRSGRPVGLQPTRV